mgnify:CR=1 FL=1
MEITLKNNNNDYLITLERNTILFGQNSAFKTNFINNLLDGFNNKKKNILINGNKFEPKDYNVICIDEEKDFTNEFKFTKTNTLKQLIYKDIINKINGDKLISYTNEIFDVIDEKVNHLLDRKINKNNDNNISFEIEIPDINSIIDKFTNIYIDNILINSSEITKSTKRKLLYQLYFLDIKNNSDKTNIIIINNFDVYLNSNEVISLLNTINKLSNDNCHFILTSSTNIFEYISLDKFSVYKVTNKLLSLNKINEAIKIYLLKKEYMDSIDFDKYYLENEKLILEEDINRIKFKILNNYPHLISKILNSTNIKITLIKPKNITCEYIICENKNIQKLFWEICTG